MITTIWNDEGVCGVFIFMGRTLQAGFGLLVVLAASKGFTQTRPAAPTLSICDIRSQSKKYLGQVVTVTGEVQRTYHGTGVSSTKCPNVGAALVESNDLRKSSTPKSQLSREGTWKTFLCTDDHVFVVTVRGRFGTALMQDIPVYRIVIDKVLGAEFTQQTSRYCMNREIPPPDIKIPSPAMPELFR
jgi:hypothetical protein